MTLTRKPFLTGGLAVAGLTAVALSLACGGGGTSVGTTNPAQPAVMNLTVSDASTEDWATIGVKILSIALIPQGGTAATAVPVYTAPSTVPVTNLVQLDQLSELLGAFTVPAGTYTGAVLTLSANPGDVTLVSSADPEQGFAVAPATTIPSSQITINGTTGTAPNLTVPVTVNLASNLIATDGQTTSLDLEFDLSHPAFIVEHLTAADVGVPTWAVNFNGPVRHHPAAMTNLILRHLYGSVTAVSTDNTAITVTKDYPVAAAAVASTQSLSILADATNGTLFYDLDTPANNGTIDNFSTIGSGLVGRYVRVAARYQVNGTLVAARIWASSSFSKVYASPEGHVLHVNAGANPPTFTVENEAGVGVPVQVNAATQFFYRTPAVAATDAAPISAANGGITFLTGKDLVRGFKVHATVDVTTVPVTAQTVDIEIAKYDGTISAANGTGFTYTRAFATAADSYTKQLDYISASSPNGTNPIGGVAIDGYKWWDFGFPTLVTVDPLATSFISAVSGSADFGGTAAVPMMLPWGVSYCAWGDPALPAGWSTRATILEPTQLPLGTVGASLNGTIFTMLQPGGANAVSVDLDATPGSATLVYQVGRQNGSKIVTVTPEDITTVNGLAAVTAGLVNGNRVKVYGVPQADHSIKAYIVFYYTGTATPTA